MKELPPDVLETFDVMVVELRKRLAETPIAMDKQFDVVSTMLHNYAVNCARSVAEIEFKRVGAAYVRDATIKVVNKLLHMEDL